MKNYGSIKIVNITIENASAIEKMVNKTKPQTTKAEKLPKELIGFLFS